jgi:hypothetical protein
MATELDQFEEWARLRDEIVVVFNRRRQTLLNEIWQCPEENIVRLASVTRVVEQVDEYLEDFTEIVVRGRVEELRTFKENFYEFALPAEGEEQVYKSNEFISLD